MPKTQFKNISFAIHILYQGMFETKPFIVPDKAVYKKDLNQGFLGYNQELNE